MPGEFDWFSPYAGAAGVLGFQFLRLSEVPASSTIHPFTTGIKLAP